MVNDSCSSYCFGPKVRQQKMRSSQWIDCQSQTQTTTKNEDCVSEYKGESHCWFSAKDIVPRGRYVTNTDDMFMEVNGIRIGQCWQGTRESDLSGPPLCLMGGNGQMT